MSQLRVFEFAKEIGMETLTLMDKIRAWKLPVKSHMVALDAEMLEKIRELMAAESESAGKKGKSKKKATKKTAAKKEVTEKKVTKKVAAKTTVTKKTVTKKAAAVKTVTKKTVTKKAGAKKASSKKATARGAGIVLRRKADQLEQEKAAAEAAAIAEEEAAIEAAALAAEEAENLEPEALEEEQVVEVSAAETGTDVGGETSAQPAKKAPRRNIVGKMDLARVREKRPVARSAAGGTAAARSTTTSRPAAGAASTTGVAAAPGKEMRIPRTGAPRNIRPGFVAPQMAEDDLKKRLEEKKKRGAGGARDGVQTGFAATEFRKREMVFQPRKKKGVLLGREAKKTQITQAKASKRVVKVFSKISVADLAQQMSIKMGQLTKSLMKNGVQARPSDVLDFETVSLIAPEFGFEAQNVHLSPELLVKEAQFGDHDAEKVLRAPVVTVMGHVDHGKTTLLDAIRGAKVASGEAGGITQHIGAYSVQLENSDKTVTFIDTPGHEAFTSMRARGANVTDIVVIVVAADDGVMPQTVEAINHAKAAGVPIVVAVNKIDRPNANPDRIKQQLGEFELVPEDWGGTTIFCNISALKKEGISELLEQLSLVAEMQELKANPSCSASGIVIESRMEKGRGNVATVLVKEGTLESGQNIVLGKVYGRVRLMVNDKGQPVKKAGPSMPVDIIGLQGSPEAGEFFYACKTEQLAREIAELHVHEAEAEAIGGKTDLSIEAIFEQMKDKEVKELPIILKADVAGSLEAIKGVLGKSGTDEVRVKLVHSGVGGINESDVLLAATSGGLVIGFNVRPDNAAQKTARQKGIEIKFYSVIYDLADEIKKALSGLLAPDIVEKTVGRAEVRNTFSIPKIGMIAGCSVIDGKVTRSNMLRLLRDGRVVYEGKLSSLKRFKDDVKEVATGYECGIGIENFNDIKVGDVIEAFVQESVEREL